MSAGGGKGQPEQAPVESIDSKLARAGRLFLSAHDSDQIDGDILLSEARETVAALVEALKTAKDRLEDMLQGDDGQAWKEARKAMPKIDAALKAAGEGL